MYDLLHLIDCEISCGRDRLKSVKVPITIQIASSSAPALWEPLEQKQGEEVK